MVVLRWEREKDDSGEAEDGVDVRRAYKPVAICLGLLVQLLIASGQRSGLMGANNK